MTKIKKFPDELKKRLSESAKMFNEAIQAVSEADALFQETFGEDSDHFPWWRCGDGTSLEEIEYGNDVSEEIAEKFNDELKKKGSVSRIY